MTAPLLPSPAATTGSQVPLNCQCRLNSAGSRVHRRSALCPRSHTSPSPSRERTASVLPTPPSPRWDSGWGARDVGASSRHPPGVASAAGRGVRMCAPPSSAPGARLLVRLPRAGERARSPAAALPCWGMVHGSLVRPAARTRGLAPGALRRASGCGGARGRGSPAPRAAARSGRARCAQPGRREAGRGRSEPGVGWARSARLRDPRPHSPLPARPAGRRARLQVSGGAACPPHSASGWPAAPASARMRGPPPSPPAEWAPQVSGRPPSHAFTR